MQRRHSKFGSKKSTSTGAIRIIAGLWRGRKLAVHDAQGLRPTTDRVKETLFNWLAPDIPNANCLDLFAGSGGLGFEAASRQADKVVMLELNKIAYQQLDRNISELRADNIQVINTDSIEYLQTSGEPFDIVFIDPPFRKGLIEQVVNLLEANGWLANNAMVYIETEKELTLPPLPSNWSLHREKVAGQVSYRLYTRTC